MDLYDKIIPPVTLAALIIYNCILLFIIRNKPDATIIGLNNQLRQKWTEVRMSGKQGMDILAVQSIRNLIMVSTMFTTASILLSTLTASVYINSVNASNLVKEPSDVTKAIVIYLSVCFLLAFFSFTQNMRYLNHFNMIITIPKDMGLTVSYAFSVFKVASNWYSLGVRFFILSSLGLVWVFGPWYVGAWGILMLVTMYLTDFTSSTELRRSASAKSIDDSSDRIIEMSQRSEH